MRDFKSGFFFLGLSLLVIWGSMHVGLGTPTEPGSGFFSFCAGIVLFVLSLMFIYRGGRIRESQRTRSHRVILVLISLFVYTVVLETAGFIVATFFLVGILFHLGKRRRWWVVLGMSVVVTSLFYLVFGIWLRVYFPRGFLGI